VSGTPESPDEIVDATNLDSRVLNAKQSEREQEQLINDFRPFILSRVGKYSYKYDEHRHEELISVAMSSFYEAISKYEKEKGHFIPFANRVINERIIDDLRKLYRREGKTLPLENREQEQGVPAMLDVISMRRYAEQARQERLVDEIEQFKLEIAEWGITMDSLAKQSPKHKSLRDNYRMAVAKVLENPDIVQTIQVKRYFPIKAISEISQLSLKKIERARSFIIASLIIRMGDYELLAEYVGDWRGFKK